MRGSRAASVTAWVLVSCALVLLMTPGLALFYGGMVRRKNVLSTFMHSFIALGHDDHPVGRDRLLARVRSGHRRGSSAASTSRS
jgi:hypothetical protein